MTIEESLTQIETATLSVVLAKTRTCSVCKPIEAKLTTLMKEYPTIPFHLLYMEDVPLFSGQHLVFTVPTVLIFHRGKEIHRESRFVSLSNIDKVLQQYLEE